MSSPHPSLSSPHPTLENRPIDQWRVTELKQELKRRNLTTKGLKEDLIKRLSEAHQNESVNAEEDVDNNSNSEPRLGVSAMDIENMPTFAELESVDHHDNISEKVDDDMAKDDVEDNMTLVGQEKGQLGEGMDARECFRSEELVIVQETTVETITTVTKVVITEMASAAEDIPNSDTQVENRNFNTHLINDDIEHQMESINSKPPEMDIIPDSSSSIKQVSEVSPVLGFKVNSDSISTDSVSINEKNVLKDNIIADNVKLELDVKKDMVETSLSKVVPDGGESHTLDNEESREMELVEDNDEKIATSLDTSKDNNGVCVGYSEKLNLDNSPSDASMEEDVIENKQTDSQLSSYQGDDVPSVVKENGHFDGACDDLTTEIKIVCPEKEKGDAHVEKRKLQDQEAVENSEPTKRQRKWNSHSVKVPEAQNSSIAHSRTPKDIKRTISRSDSTKSEAALKERVVSPSLKPPTNSLRIDRFVRPFTLKAVQEFLGKTGTVISFWMDHIKTHCYITYSSVEEAIETRNTVFNLQWPPNGGLLLVAEFVDPEEVKLRVAPPQLLFSPRQQPALRPPFLSNPLPVRERLSIPSPALSNLPPVRELPPPLSDLPHVKERSNLSPVKERLNLPLVREQSNRPPIRERSKLPDGKERFDQPPVRERANQPPVREQANQPPVRERANQSRVRERLTLPPPPPLADVSHVRERLVLPPPPPLSDLPPFTEKVALPPPPPIPKNFEPSVITLDDLFQKTRASPRIYYLPLSDEQVAARGKNFMEN